MTDLRPKATIHKILISTTSRFIGEYKNKGILITHAWPDYSEIPSRVSLTENAFCRNSFVISFETEPIENKTIAPPNYSPTGDILCAYLSILFGKRFDNHGFLESMGLFHLPQFHQYSIVCNPNLPHNNHRPRKDLEIELNLTQLSRIERVIFDNNLDSRFINFLKSAGRFYLQSLQTIERQPETAYLNLITCGEILSNYFEYNKDTLPDEKSKTLLAQIEECCQDGKALSMQVKGKFLQIKRRFVKTIVYLLNDYFFSNTKSQHRSTSLKCDDIEARIAAAYDLRSRYLHTGIEFGNWIYHGAILGAEVQLGKPVVEDRKFQNILDLAPTYLGLERIMRFCLLRFMQLNGIDIDQRLNNEETTPRNRFELTPKNRRKPMKTKIFGFGSSLLHNFKIMYNFAYNFFVLLIKLIQNEQTKSQ